MGSKTAMRIITVSLALLFMGMFFPGPAKASDSSISTDAPENVFDFGEVLIGSEGATQILGIRNDNDSTTFTLLFNLLTGGECGFSFDTSKQMIPVVPHETVKLDVSFNPSAEDTCSGTLQVWYTVDVNTGDWGLVEVELDATGAYDILPMIMIGGLDTGIEDQPYNGQLISQSIDGCAAGAKSHGEFVNCVGELTNGLNKDGLITGAEKGVIQSAAAESNLP